MSDIASQGGDLKELASPSRLQLIIECPICKTIPLPPIFNCAKGHIICGKCKMHMPKCGLCQADVTESRNFVLEEIVGSSKMACEFLEQGCKSILLGDALEDHLANCDFRPILCVCGYPNACEHPCANAHQYAEHIVAVHGTNILMCTDGAVVQQMRLTEADIEDGDAWCGSGVFIFQGEGFQTLVFLQEDVFHFIVCIIGSERDAEKYGVCVQLKSPGNPIPLMETKVPVVPIRRPGLEIGKCVHVMLSREMMGGIYKICTTPENGRELIWDVEYKVLDNRTSAKELTNSSSKYAYCNFL